MEVQSVINESALKEARKYLIKPGIRKISAIASAAFVLLAAYCMLTGRPSTMLLAVFAIVIFYGELKSSFPSFIYTMFFSVVITKRNSKHFFN